MEDDPGDRPGETCIGALDIGGTKSWRGSSIHRGKLWRAVVSGRWRSVVLKMWLRAVFH